MYLRKGQKRCGSQPDAQLPEQPQFAVASNITSVSVLHMEPSQ